VSSQPTASVLRAAGFKSRGFLHRRRASACRDCTLGNCSTISCTRADTPRVVSQRNAGHSGEPYGHIDGATGREVRDQLGSQHDRRSGKPAAKRETVRQLPGLDGRCLVVGEGRCDDIRHVGSGRRIRQSKLPSLEWWLTACTPSLLSANPRIVRPRGGHFVEALPF